MAWRDMNIGQIEGLMRRHNEHNGITCKGKDPEPIRARILFKEEAFSVKFPEDKRVYEFTSDNKAYIPGQSSNSIFLSRINPDGDRCLFTYDILKVYDLDPEDLVWSMIWTE